MSNISNIENYRINNLSHDLVDDYNDVLMVQIHCAKQDCMDEVEFQHRLFTSLLIKNPDIVFAIRDLLRKNDEETRKMYSLELLQNTIRAMYRRSWYGEEWYVIDKYNNTNHHENDNN